MDEELPSVEGVSIVGLGKLGAPLAAVYADSGFPTIGVDVNHDTIALVEAGRAPVREPELQVLLDRNLGRLRATPDYQEAIEQSDLTCIIVPTPSTETGFFTTRYIEQAISQIGESLRSKGGYHLVVIVSTVMPGDTRRLGGHLEQASGRILGEDLGLCYSPEFIALGSVIQNITHPDMLLIGELDEVSGNLYQSVLQQVVKNSPPIARMNLVNAELAKLAVNGFVTTKISYANMLAEICEKLPGADVDEVTSAIGLDSRIGGEYLRGALSFGGPCFPRDNIALSRFASRVGVKALIPEATHQLNLDHDETVMVRIRETVPAGSRVAVLGLAYKPETPVVQESAGLRLLSRLREEGYLAVGYDPLANESASDELGSAEWIAERARDALADSAAVVVAIPAEEFSRLTKEDWTLCKEDALIIDAWRTISRRSLASDQRHDHLGVGPPMKSTGSLRA